MTDSEIGEDLAYIEDALRGVEKARAEIGEFVDERTCANAANFLAHVERVNALIGVCVAQLSALRHRKTDILLVASDSLNIRYLDAVDRANALRTELQSLIALRAQRIHLARQVVAGRA